MKGYMNARYFDAFMKLFESLPRMGVTRSVADAMMLTEVSLTRSPIAD